MPASLGSVLAEWLVEGDHFASGAGFPERQMADVPFDPMAAWQKFVGEWEKQINEASARITATEEFSRALNQAAKFQVAAQQQYDKQMEQFLKTLHLASKSDITAIHDRLAAIEDAIARIGSGSGRDAAPPTIQVARTRRPPREGG